MSEWTIEFSDTDKEPAVSHRSCENTRNLTVPMKDRQRTYWQHVCWYCDKEIPKEFIKLRILFRAIMGKEVSEEESEILRPEIE